MTTFLTALGTLVAVGCLLTFGCGTGSRNVLVTFVDGDRGVTVDRPLSLLVEINSDGKLRLNRIEIGTIEDTSVLRERLQAVFEDRDKASITERDILIEMNGPIERDDLDRLINAMENAHASSIQVTRKGHE